MFKGTRASLRRWYKGQPKEVVQGPALGGGTRASLRRWHKGQP
jgi:hypothetical protein